MKAICKDYAEFKNSATILKSLGTVSVLFTTKNSPMLFRAVASGVGTELEVLLDELPLTWSQDFPGAVEVETILN